MALPPAVILAAGAGSRLRGDDLSAPPKPLTYVHGRPLIERTLRTLRAAGVGEVVVVLGYEQDRIVPHLERIADRVEIHVTPVPNHQWERGNSTSVLAAAEHVDDRFFLAMSDHLFDPAFLSFLLREDHGAALSLVVDHDWESVPDVDEATKVRLDGRHITDIGKNLPVFDAVDTGVFLCRPRLFEAIRRAQWEGDFSLSGAVRWLSLTEEARVVPSDGRFWMDVDTPEDLVEAERRLARGPSHSHRPAALMPPRLPDHHRQGF